MIESEAVSCLRGDMESGSENKTTPAGPERANLEWAEWLPMVGDDWRAVIPAELVELGRSDQQVPHDADEAMRHLASARAALIRCSDERGAVAACIVRASGWPGPTG